jgi:two-component system sensor histidine kinase/response regulator
MDCQMPVMDGYTATLLIRARARASRAADHRHDGQRHGGDRERVLARTGMNDHIAKPHGR